MGRRMWLCLHGRVGAMNRSSEGRRGRHALAPPPQWATLRGGGGGAYGQCPLWVGRKVLVPREGQEGERRVGRGEEGWEGERRGGKG